MKIKELNIDNDTRIYEIINTEDANELFWEVEATIFQLIPDVEGDFFIPGKFISNNKVQNCYIQISTPERIVENLIVKNGENFMYTSIYDINGEIVPSIGAECFGNYELYYSKSNPKIGIEILKNSLKKFPTSASAEDLGYIYRDENIFQEAINSFLLSEELGESSEFIFLELSNLYGEIGEIEKSKLYKKKFK